MTTILNTQRKPTNIKDLEKEEQAALDELWEVWEQKLTRNALKEEYYDLKGSLENMGISIPPELERFGTVVGWSAKAVDLLANRSIFEGFGFQDKRNADLDAVLQDNNFDILYQQAVQSELINSCSFFTVTKGDKGEPDAIISCYSASEAAAIWDARKKRVRYGFAITETDDGDPSGINLFMPDGVVSIKRDGSAWTAIRHTQKIERPLIEPLVHRPSLKRPFGKSRISRAVIALTKAAMRTSLRTEVSAEVFTLPQRYLLGVDDDFWEPPGRQEDEDDGREEKPQTTDLKRAKWDASFAAVFSVGLNAEGDKPTYGQLPQMSMEPHVAHFRLLAGQFAGETSVPLSSLGVVHDNPSSAEAIYAAKEDLVIEASNLNKTNGVALRNVGLMALAIIQDKSIADLTDDDKTIAVNWKNPSTPSIVSQADAMVKLYTVAPWIADSDVLLEEMGFNDEQRRRLEGAREKSKARAMVNAALASGPAGNTKEQTTPAAAGGAQSAEVSGKQLNGAQTQSLITIMSQFVGGAISEGQAVNLIGAAIGVSKSEAKDILDGKLD